MSHRIKSIASGKNWGVRNPKPSKPIAQNVTSDYISKSPNMPTRHKMWTTATSSLLQGMCRALYFSAMMLLVRCQEGHPACKKSEWWGAGMVICLEQSADLHMAQLMPLPLTVSCFSKIQIGFVFLVPAHLGSPRKRAVKRVCVCVCVEPLSLHNVAKQ